VQRQGHSLIIISLLFVLEDIFWLNLLFFSMLSPFQLYFGELYRIVFILINLGYLLSFVLIRVDFNDVKQLHIPHLIRRNIYKLVITALIVTACMFFLKIAEDVSRLFVLTYFSIACILLTVTQWITRKVLTFTFRRTISKGVILGSGQLAENIFTEMLRNVYNGVVILGFFDDNPKVENKILLGDLEYAKKFILKYGVSNVFCTLPASEEKKISDFIKFAESHVINFHIVPGFNFYGYHHTGAVPNIEYIGQMPVFVLRNIPLSYLHNAFLKRSLDILFSLMAVIILFPLLFPVLSILIKISSPGPIFFKQERTGKRGKTFNCYKFRTMRLSTDADTKQATINDYRKTKIGNFLRRTSLDELPQFYNVLIGNMSLVGPRPHMLTHTYEYSPKVDKYMVRHFVKPGITGLAQVSGYRGETKDIEMMQKRIMTDIYYLENWTWKLDFKIIFKTILLLIKGDEKAY